MNLLLCCALSWLCASLALRSHACNARMPVHAAGLRQDGLDWSNVLFVNLALADMSAFAAANAAYCSIVPQRSAPARACTSLPSTATATICVDVLVARLASAAAQDAAGVAGLRRTLHVQSISEWAPACIGPYSQATLQSGLLCMAGQIPLQPATMEVCHACVWQRVYSVLQWACGLGVYHELMLITHPQVYLQSQYLKRASSAGAAGRAAAGSLLQALLLRCWSARVRLCQLAAGCNRLPH